MNDKVLVFVDTNVLVYALTLGNDPRHAEARVRYEELIQQDRLCLSTQVLQELLVTLSKKIGLPIDQAIQVIEDLADYPLFTIDRKAIVDAGWRARDTKISFWDALIVVAAERLGAGVLLTEDLNHGQTIGSVRVENPFRLPYAPRSGVGSVSE